MSILPALPIIVPALSGLTYLAYKHPRSYAHLFDTVSPKAGYAFVIVLAYLAGYSSGVKEFTPSSPADIVEKAKKAIDAADANFVFVLFVIGGIWGYLALLKELPNLLKRDETSKPAEVKEEAAVK